MAPSILVEKDFSRILTDMNGYGHVCLDRIRERNWYGLVYDNSKLMHTIVLNLSRNSTHALTLPLLILTITNLLCTLTLGTS